MGASRRRILCVTHGTASCPAWRDAPANLEINVMGNNYKRKTQPTRKWTPCAENEEANRIGVKFFRGRFCAVFTLTLSPEAACHTGRRGRRKGQRITPQPPTTFRSVDGRCSHATRSVPQRRPEPLLLHSRHAVTLQPRASITEEQSCALASPTVTKYDLKCITHTHAYLGCVRQQLPRVQVRHEVGLGADERVEVGGLVVGPDDESNHAPHGDNPVVALPARALLECPHLRRGTHPYDTKYIQNKFNNLPVSVSTWFTSANVSVRRDSVRSSFAWLGSRFSSARCSAVHNRRSCALQQGSREIEIGAMADGPVCRSVYASEKTFFGPHKLQQMAAAHTRNTEAVPK